MTNRKGLVLDFGGVLTTPLVPAALAFEKRAGLPEGALINALYLDEEMSRRTAELERGAITQTRWNTEAAARLGVSADNLMGRIFADLRPEPSVIAAAAAARRAGVKVGILSNSVGTGPWNLYAGYELERRYDAVVISEQHGLRKPQPQIFELALRMLELPADQCVFVDDSEQYLAPAAELGLLTVHAKEPRRTIAEMETALGISLTTETDG
ncbi:HAD-IA family hydrolase [Streptomyces longispororuber]|uniref:HAD-IA family hydrolase n=1 Tax=Streptomyces longispororuber TaxID=68230 RepID=UPI00210D2571|nr:HAD-IA family hydrolase [Streptomyces longispororuber]MCQ4213333.1 HAD-IA family hydrolase [Streptomyces longispororuber]